MLEEHCKHTYRGVMSLHTLGSSDSPKAETILPGISWNARQRGRLQRELDALYGPDSDDDEPVDGTAETGSGSSVASQQKVQKRLFDDAYETGGNVRETLSGAHKEEADSADSGTVHPHDDPVRQEKIEQGRRKSEIRKRRLRHGL